MACRGADLPRLSRRRRRRADRPQDGDGRSDAGAGLRRASPRVPGSARDLLFFVAAAGLWPRVFVVRPQIFSLALFAGSCGCCWRRNAAACRDSGCCRRCSHCGSTCTADGSSASARCCCGRQSRCPHGAVSVPARRWRAAWRWCCRHVPEPVRRRAVELPGHDGARGSARTSTTGGRSRRPTRRSSCPGC